MNFVAYVHHHYPNDAYITRDQSRSAGSASQLYSFMKGLSRQSHSLVRSPAGIQMLTVNWTWRNRRRVTCLRYIYSTGIIDPMGAAPLIIVAVPGRNCDVNSGISASTNPSKVQALGGRFSQKLTVDNQNGIIKAHGANAVSILQCNNRGGTLESSGTELSSDKIASLFVDGSQPSQSRQYCM